MTAVLILAAVGVLVTFIAIDRRSAKNIAILIGILVLIIIVLILNALRE
jgi:hypothetical protein